MSDTDIPGNVGELEALATQLSTAVDTVRTIKVGVTDDLSDWTGTGATAFRAVLEQFTPGFERADAALAYGSTAIARFAGELGDFQTSAASYLREIDASQEALDNANARRVAAEQAVEREIRAVAHNPVHAITAELDAARAELDEVNSLVDRFTLELEEWLTRASANYSAYQDAVRACAAAIEGLITGTSTNIEIRNGDIHIEPISNGDLNLGALNTSLSASTQAWAAANPSQSAPYNSRIITLTQSTAVPDDTYVGKQCLAWVLSIVKAAGGPSLAFGNDPSTYQDQWRQVATQIATPQAGWADVRPGDVVQFLTPSGEHTAIITGGNSPSTATVVDSNFHDVKDPDVVFRGSFESRAASFGNSNYVIWRIDK